METKVLTALLCFTVKSNAEMDIAREVKRIKRRNNTCVGWWEEVVEKESYMQEKGGKIVSGVGLCEEHGYFMHHKGESRVMGRGGDKGAE